MSAKPTAAEARAIAVRRRAETEFDRLRQVALSARREAAKQASPAAASHVFWERMEAFFKQGAG